MALVTATGAWTSTFTILPQTGFVYFQDGIIDPLTGVVTAPSTGRWAVLSGTTWSSWRNYRQQLSQIKWTAPLLDLGSPQYFALNVACDFQGTMQYLIHTSTTGDFATDVEEYLITGSDLNITSFYGQFVYVTAILDGPELRRMTVTTDTTSRQLQLVNVNSSTLSGSNTARQIPLPGVYSSIKEIHIQPKAATAYAVNLYVSDTATSVVTIPVVVSKSSTPTFALYGIDNEPRDAVVDITLEVMPRMAMIGGNLTVID